MVDNEKQRSSGTKPFNLEDRTFAFAQDVLKYLKKLPKSQSNLEHSKQLIRSSGSVGANYIEANEALSKRDFVNRIKICRKEAKESAYWLKLLEGNHDDNRIKLIDEATQLVKIFNAIIYKTIEKQSKSH